MARPVPPLPDPEPIAPAGDPTAMIRSLGDPPLPGFGVVAQRNIVLVTARAEEVGNNEGEIDATIRGEEAKIAFNSRYLIEVLQVLDSERVAIETTSPSSPGVLRPVGDDTYVHVVMPMFVTW